MKSSQHGIRTTHTGSLVRTPELVELMIQSWLGRAPEPGTFEAALRDGVLDVVNSVAARDTVA
jgi:hypothetical protein